MLPQMHPPCRPCPCPDAGSTQSQQDRYKFWGYQPDGADLVPSYSLLLCTWDPPCSYSCPAVNFIEHQTRHPSLTNIIIVVLLCTPLSKLTLSTIASPLPVCLIEDLSGRLINPFVILGAGPSLERAPRSTKTPKGGQATIIHLHNVPT